MSLLEEFDSWREAALAMGFVRVAAGPFVRSSYHRSQFLPCAADVSARRERARELSPVSSVCVKGSIFGQGAGANTVLTSYAILTHSQDGD